MKVQANCQKFKLLHNSSEREILPNLYRKTEDILVNSNVFFNS